MKLLYAEAWGYFGILDGLGQHKISIDFTKCQHKLIIIRGDNGSGKSTIYGFLNPLPDSNDSFVPGVEAGKILTYQDGDNQYIIKYIHSINDRGERLTTKAYISKSIDGQQVQLNESGNVSNCKDIIYSEFKLDANFVALSQLSSGDRGLADKKPAERKKYANSIIGTLEVYNHICKTMTKRSSIFKSMINSLTSKIESIGDEAQLNVTLSSLDTRIKNATAQKEDLLQLSAKSSSMIEILDPGLSIQTEQKRLIDEISSISQSNISLKNSIDSIMNDCNISSMDMIKSSYDTVCNKINELKVSIKLASTSIDDLIAQRTDDSNQLTDKIIKLRSYTSDDNIESIRSYIQYDKSGMEECEKTFKMIGMIDNNITKDDYILALNTLQSMKEIVDIFKSNFDHDVLTIAFHNKDKYPDQQYLMNRLDSEKDKISNMKLQYNEMSLAKDKLSIRPDNCHINDCPYLISSVAFDEKTYMTLEKDITELSKQIDDDTILFALNQSVIECMNYISRIMRYIEGNKHILSKLPNGNIYSDSNVFMNRLLNNDTFDEISQIYKYIDQANLFEEYQLYKDNLVMMQEKLSKYESKEAIINEITNDINRLTERTNKLQQNIDEINKNIVDYQDILVKAETVRDKLLSILNSMAIFDSNNSKLIELSKQQDAIKESMTKIQDCILKVNQYNEQINELNAELTPLLDDRDKIKHGISLIKDYNQELALYKAKYEKIETIKYYSSPTKGIQNLFMAIYMNDVVGRANSLLSLLFDGKYEIQPFIINESEFSIPCIGEGLMHDDISNMSTSQVCMISMIISFSLLFQSSTKYNILKLDEIDGGLDTNNRLQFINLLYTVIDMLECEQCIIISHNSELSTANADVIVLKTSIDEEIEGNIIYRYQ